MQGNNLYKLQLPHIGTIPQVPLEVEAIHKLVNETEGVCLGRVHTHERHYTHVSVVEEAPHLSLVVKPLQDVSRDNLA